MPTYGTIQVTVFCQSFEPKMSTWRNEKRSIISLVHPIQQLNSYWKLKSTQKNTKQCGKPADIYPTSHDSFYVAKFGGGSDLRSGRFFGKERSGTTQLSQKIPAIENNGFVEL